jgi:hypothetical protein
VEVQHINVKIYSTTPDAVSLDRTILIFHRWIQENLVEELLIDVADYSHVPAGPGVMLIGHQASYSVEPGAEERPGLLYNVRVRREGGNRDRFAHALGQAIKACDLLEQDPLWKDRVLFDAGDLYVLINDRALAPNTPESFAALKDELTEALQQVMGDVAFEISYEQGDPRARLKIRVKADRKLAPRDVLQTA